MTTWVTPTRPIGSGESLLVVVPSPSSPQVLSPQAQALMMVPAAAMVAQPSLATWVTPVRPGTAAGVAENPPEVPLPSSPLPLLPQLNSVPSERTAKLSRPPEATWVIPVRWGTGSGSDSLYVVPSPRAPLPLSPQDQTVPSDRSASA